MKERHDKCFVQVSPDGVITMYLCPGCAKAWREFLVLDIHGECVSMGSNRRASGVVRPELNQTMRAERTSPISPFDPTSSELEEGR